MPPIPEMMMSFFRQIVARRAFVCGVFAAGLALSSVPVRAAGEFPFDRELLLDAAPMKPGKRMPMLTVAPNGDASFDLWCKTVTAHVEVSDAAIKIEPGALPEALPEMMGNGQCTPQRLQADQDLLAAVAQVTAWRNQGSALALEGPKILKFKPASN
jgi:heat shock protein HslJ